MPNTEAIMELSQSIELALSKTLDKFARTHQDLLIPDAVHAAAVGIHMALIKRGMGDTGCMVLAELLEDLVLVHNGYHELHNSKCEKGNN
jgi:hypothetical protein